MFRPSTRISPALSSRNPARSIKAVDLPDPLGPSRVRNSPGSTESVTSWIAITVPYFFVTPTKSTEAPPDGRLLAAPPAAVISRERTAPPARDRRRRAHHGENSHRSGLKRSQHNLIQADRGGKPARINKTCIFCITRRIGNETSRSSRDSATLGAPVAFGNPVSAEYEHKVNHSSDPSGSERRSSVADERSRASAGAPFQLRVLGALRTGFAGDRPSAALRAPPADGWTVEEYNRPPQAIDPVGLRTIGRFLSVWSKRVIKYDRIYREPAENGTSTLLLTPRLPGFQRQRVSSRLQEDKPLI
jgi:hypothetical protein